MLVHKLLQSAGGSPSDPNFENVTLLLHGDGTNGGQNNTFVDGSTNNFTITRNGNTTQGSFSPYGDLWSNYFDGSGDYFTVSYNSVFNLAGNTFTVEAWICLTGDAAVDFDGKNVSTIAAYGGATTNTGWSFNIIQSGTNSINFQTNGSGVNLTSANFTFAKNKWYHVAFVRNGSANAIYVDGVSQTLTTNTYSGVSTINQSLKISSERIFTNYNHDFVGYISNFRIVNGSAVYTGNFTPSTAPLTAITNTSFLTCQSNRFRDNSSNNFTITRNGDVSVQRFSPFAPSAAYSTATIGGSGYFDGTGDYLRVGAASDWTFLSNTTALWSVEMWVYVRTGGVFQTLLDTANATTANIGISITITSGNLVNVQIYYGSAGNFIVNGSSTTAVQINAWNHIVITYDQSLASQNLKFYINGGAAETANKTGNTPSSSNPFGALSIATYGAGGGNFINGYIGSMRISNSIRSSGVPTSPYTNDANTKLLLNFTNAAIFDNAMMNDLETVGNAQISTSVKKYGTGSLAFDGSGDRLIVPTNQLMDLSVGDFTVECWIYSNTVAAGEANVCYRGAAGNISLASELQWAIYRSGSNLLVRPYQGTSDFTITVGTISANTWHHVAITRSGNTVRGFLNGVQGGTTQTVSGALNNNVIWFGAIVGLMTVSSVDQAWNGYIDDLRITKGVARYTSSFTPPAAPFANK